MVIGSTQGTVRRTEHIAPFRACSVLIGCVLLVLTKGARDRWTTMALPHFVPWMGVTTFAPGSRVSTFRANCFVSMVTS